MHAACGTCKIAAQSARSHAGKLHLHTSMHTWPFGSCERLSRAAIKCLWWSAELLAFGLLCIARCTCEVHFYAACRVSCQSHTCVDSNHASTGIKQWPATVARIDCRICLDNALNGPACHRLDFASSACKQDSPLLVVR